MTNWLTIGERPKKKKFESPDLTRKVNILRLWRGNLNLALEILNKPGLQDNHMKVIQSNFNEY